MQYYVMAIMECDVVNENVNNDYYVENNIW